MNIIDGKLLAQRTNQLTQKEVTNFKNTNGRPPKLSVILVGNNPASEIYVASKQKKCKELGIESAVIKFNTNVSETQLLKTIKQLNTDKLTDAILVQLPLPEGLDAYKITNSISPQKDVDGLTDANLGKLTSKHYGIIPCTAHGILKMLEGKDVRGKNAVVVGRSLLVGKPIATLLTNLDATVTLCHSKTKNLEKIVQKADILVVAIGQPRFIKKVKKGAIVIDVGINRVDDKLCGDVDFESVKNIAREITPVPGGVGPMTIAMLMHNTLLCANNNVNS